MNYLLEEVCGYLHNYFIHEVHTGDFSIKDGVLDVDFLKEEQFFRIVGSVFNDCVCQYPYAELTDEDFSGVVWSMAVPPSLIDLLADIQAWIDEYGSQDSGINSPVTSESFNNYSYSKASGTNADGSYAPLTWQNIFANRLARWRKLP